MQNKIVEHRSDHFIYITEFNIMYLTRKTQIVLSALPIYVFIDLKCSICIFMSNNSPFSRPWYLKQAQHCFMSACLRTLILVIFNTSHRAHFMCSMTSKTYECRQ